MTDAARQARGTASAPGPPGGPAGRPPGPGRQWVIGELGEIRSVLGDERFIVAQAQAGAPPGTVAWLRASVPRFCNGAEHERRRAVVAGQLGLLDPAALRLAAYQYSRAALPRDGRPAARADVTALARRVPATVPVAQFGAADPELVAGAVAGVAAAYFPGASAVAERAGDAAVSALMDLLPAAAPDVAVARIAALVQGYDATAALIDAALWPPAGSPGAAGSPGDRGDRGADELRLAGWRPTGTLLAEAAFRRPPARAIRRIASVPVVLGDRAVAAGDLVICDIDAVAQQRPGPPAEPGSPPGSSGAWPTAQSALTFGYGLRPCPGSAHALALAGGVIDAVAEHHGAGPDAPA